MSGRAIAAVVLVAGAAFGGGYALASSGDEQAAPTAAPKALELPAAAVAAQPARSTGALPDIIAPPRATPQGPGPTATAQPPGPGPGPAPGPGPIIEG